jgi:hypothetical protein
VHAPVDAPEEAAAFVKCFFRKYSDATVTSATPAAENKAVVSFYRAAASEGTAAATTTTNNNNNNKQ